MVVPLLFRRVREQKKNNKNSLKIQITFAYYDIRVFNADCLTRPRLDHLQLPEQWMAIVGMRGFPCQSPRAEQNDAEIKLSCILLLLAAGC